MLAKLFDKIIALTTAGGELLVGRKLNFKLSRILTGVMWGWWWWSCLSWWWLYEDLFSEMIRIGLLSCHKDPQYKIMNHIIKNIKWGWISHCLLTMGDPQSSLRTGTNFVLDKSNSWINFDEFNSKHNFSANSDGELWSNENDHYHLFWKFHPNCFQFCV